MKNNRREFLKIAGLAGVGLSGAGLFSYAASSAKNVGASSADQPRPRSGQRFNMSGYAAPALDRVRIGYIGIGGRGAGAVTRLTRIEGVEIKALCDILPDRAVAGAERLKKVGLPKPDLYTAGENDWKKVCDRDDIDLIYVSTPWKLHAPIAAYAMNHGKHAAVEVPVATTLDECWQLVETSEKTRKHCMMISNVCYDFFEMMVLNMCRQGFFGDIIHGEGAYLHTFGFNPENKIKTWRISENATRNGNLYPTHGAGPVCQAMNINCGDRIDFLVSVSSNDFMMRNEFSKAATTDDFWKPFSAQANKSHRGNINTSAIRTVRGSTMMMQHDITSSQPYSRIHKLSGTKAVALKYPEPPKIAVGHKDWVTAAEFKALETKYTPEIVRRIGDMARKVGGHGGMDFMLDWRLIDCLRNGLPLDMSVYDGVTWSAIGPLSEWSVAHRSNSIDFPDFTSGAWKTNQPGMDIMLNKGGTTKVVQPKA